MKITIFTATYNREALLPRLYESIVDQHNNEFEWLIIDDGSTDNTKILVENWQKQAEFPITYVYQKNMGKWKAFNNAVILAKGELFFCVDSDDLLAPNALNVIFKLWASDCENAEYGGIIAKKKDFNDNILSKPFPQNIKSVDTFTLTEKYKCTGEFALIYQTKILRKHLFPELKEKFITECVVYDKIAKDAELLVLDDVVNLCEYQSDGLSGNPYKLMLSNPIGYQIYYLQRADMHDDWKKRFQCLLRHQAFRRISHNDDYAYEGKHQIANGIASLFGVLLQYYYKFKVFKVDKGE